MVIVLTLLAHCVAFVLGFVVHWWLAEDQRMEWQQNATEASKHVWYLERENHQLSEMLLQMEANRKAGN